MIFASKGCRNVVVARGECGVRVWFKMGDAAACYMLNENDFGEEKN